MEIAIEILGWVGMALVLSGYALNTFGKIDAGTPAYIWMNIIGSLFLIVNTLFHHTYPPAVLNIIWMALGLISITRLYMRKS